MIKAKDAIGEARRMLGTPYSQMDCIGLIRAVIRACPGGVTDYRCQGTNWLWRSIENASKYRHLVWRQEGIAGAKPGMLAFKRQGEDVHHIGIVAERPLCGMQRGEDRESQGAEGDYASSPDGNQLTVIHSSSAKGCVVETALDRTWDLLGRHKYIEVDNSLSLPAADSSLKREPWGDDTGAEDAWADDGPEAIIPEIVILDSEGNRFEPVGDFRVLIGGVD